MIGKNKDDKAAPAAPEAPSAADPQVGEILERLRGLQGPDGGVTGVLMIKDPGALQAAESYEGLRKQVVAAASSRRTHLGQLAAMAVALQRATSLDDLRPQLKEWMTQAGVVEVRNQRDGHQLHELFESLDGTPLAGTIEIVEPAYVDDVTNAIVRLGRARGVSDSKKRAASPANAEAPPEPEPAEPVATDTQDEETT